MIIQCSWEDADISRAGQILRKHLNSDYQHNGFRMGARRAKWIASNYRQFIDGGKCTMLEQTARGLIQLRKAQKASHLQVG